MKKKASLWKSIQLGLGVLLVMIVYAYGFEITKVNMTELRSPQRQQSLVRVMRALARPDIFAYEQKEVVVNAPIYVPCPENAGAISLPDVDRSGAFITFKETCANPGDTIEVEGFNFAPNATGPLRFVPGNDPTYQLSLGRDTATTDDSGHFVASLTIPDRKNAEPQYVRATIRQNVGAPQLTKTAKDTWEKIVETVFLALLATTLGTILAIPLSFIAAQNLMKMVKSPLASVALSVLGWPIGIALGFLVVKTVGDFTIPLSTNWITNVVSVAVSPVAFLAGIRFALPAEELQAPGLLKRIARYVVLFLAILVAFFGLYQLAGLVSNIGTALQKSLGAFGFLGGFLFQLSDILRTITPAVGSLAAGGAVASFLGRIGQRSTERFSAPRVKIMNIVLAIAAGATLFILLGQLVEWLYQVGRPLYTLWAPGIAGGLLGLTLAALTRPKNPLPIGIVIYFITRTFLNALRSVEALVMAIVFVIAVGIGPFAGVMALGLHTIVSLAKLYSEQVESILPGPLEAVEATGANRLQTIVYAVIPQIIPPYISYTMYRWDINVRMSTIIGFVGGGGIGFLLQQNINLLNYRAASAQMLAIAVVVASMDYISAKLREKII